MSLLSTIGSASGRAFGFTRSAIAAATDAFFNRVTLLLNTSSTNGAQNNTFLDSSSNNFTITRNGNTTQGTFTPFSQTGWSNNFNSTSTGFTGSATGGLVSSTTSSFTAECWVYMTQAPTAGTSPAIIGIDCLNGSSTYLSFYVNSSRNVGILWFDSATKTCTGNTVIALNTWSHIAVSVNANAIQLYVDGVAQTLTGTTTLTNRGGTTNAFTIALQTYTTAYQFYGYLSNVRVVSGASLYNSAFTPSTSALGIAGSGTTTLLTCQSNRFVDNSSSPKTLTLSGTPSVQAFSPFAPTAAYSTTTVGGSGYFDGTSDYLSNASNTIIPSTGDFTVELWIYPTQVSTLQYLISTTSNTGNKFHLYINASAYLGVQTGSSYRDSSTTKVVANAWNYIACTRTGSTYALYVNGVSQTISGTGTMASTLDVTPTQIGSRDSALNPITGYLSNFRVSTTVRTITLPTAPYSSDGNTNLLLSFTNAGIYDAAAKNVLETVGNAQVSTTQAKFGTTSMYFDGSTDYLTCTSLNNALGTGDFTIEFWINGTYSGTKVLVDWNSTPQLYMSGTSIIWFWTSARITGTLTSNTWQHVAIVRASGVTKMYIDGTANATTWTDSTSITTQTLTIGGRAADITNTFNGYMDDIRITRYARYTSNFSVPTAAFPVQ